MAWFYDLAVAPLVSEQIQVSLRSGKKKNNKALNPTSFYSVQSGAQ